MAFRRARQLYRIMKVGLPLARLRPDADRTVADLIEELAERRTDHPFVRYQDRSVSYGEYNAAANRVAHWAQGIGIAQGYRVALLMENRPEFLETWAGLAKLGVTVALINTNLNGRALHHAIEAGQARHVIVGAECLPSWRTCDPDPDWQVWVRAAEDAVAELPPGAHDHGRALEAVLDTDPDRSLRAGITAGDDLFYIYTSGTTGLPKAARFSHLKFMTAGSASLLAGFAQDDVMYCALPLYHSAGGGMAVGAVLMSGGTLALRRKFSASHFWEDIHRFEATAFQYIGEFCRYLLHQPPGELDRGHHIRFAIGNGLRPDIWEAFRDRFDLEQIVEFYGATEGNVALVNTDNTVGSVGKIPSRLLMNARLIRYDVESDAYARDEIGRCVECVAGEVGELLGGMPRGGGSRGRFEGYTSKEATEEKILRDVFKKGDAYFRTGDLLRRDEKGYFYFIDRIGDTFRWKGENVSTQEVAEALTVFPGVKMVNVYGVEVPDADGRAGMAAILVDDLDGFDGAAFWSHATGTLAPYQVPAFLRLQRDAEVTGTFKLRKVDLQKEGYDLEVVKDPLWVRDDAAHGYVPLTPGRLDAVKSGALRL
jgi:fatty-acyl-CoA synthase